MSSIWAKTYRLDDCVILLDMTTAPSWREKVMVYYYYEKFWRVFHDRELLGRCFRGFVLPVLEYCSAVWCSAADTHLKLSDAKQKKHVGFF